MVECRVRIQPGLRLSQSYGHNGVTSLIQLDRVARVQQARPRLALDSEREVALVGYPRDVRKNQSWRCHVVGHRQVSLGGVVRDVSQDGSVVMPLLDRGQGGVNPDLSEADVLRHREVIAAVPNLGQVVVRAESVDGLDQVGVRDARALVGRFPVEVVEAEANAGVEGVQTHWDNGVRLG